MHAILLGTDEIDYNLYPALLQVFVIILIGYLAACFELLDKNQSLGLNKFVSTFALPALLFRSTAVLDFSSVNWLFLTSIFISKTTVFLLVIFVTLLTLRPVNIGMAAVFAIFVSQSNDFALGYPILQAVYAKTHPEYLSYIYLIAPISLCILNPIAFFMMEANEVLAANRQVTNATFGQHNKSSDDENETDQSDFERNSNTMSESTNFISSVEVNRSDDLDRIQKVEDNNLQATSSNISPEFQSLIDKNNLNKIKMPKKLSTIELLKKTFLSTISNPIVFMTIIGLASSFILNRKIPSLIDPILLTLSNSFSALALFYLGFTMVGKIKNLKFSSIVIIMTLIFTKSVIYPLITRELVLHLNSGSKYNQTEEDVESLSTFGFLYGTFPTAPSLFFYLIRFKAIGDDLISSALVFGTLASAPLMMVSGKMISLKYNSSQAYNFEDIECKTAYGFSFLTWFCCIWVLYIFLASGRAFLKSHRFVFWLIVSQMVNSLVHIIWANVTSNTNNLDPIYGYLHVIIALFTTFLTRCLPLAMMLNVAAISGVNKFSHRPCLEVLVRLGQSSLVCYGIGVGLPAFMTLMCVLAGGIPQKQTMMVTMGKAQIIISNVLLFSMIFGVFCCVVVFSRAKNENNSFLSFISNSYPKRKKAYSLLAQDPNNNEIEDIADRARDSHQDDAENGNLLNENNGKNEMHDPDYLTELNNTYQITKQIALIIILTFNSFMVFFFQMWILFDEVKSGLFFELQLIDTTLLYGQGFLTFLVFGFDNEYIFSPIAFKIKELLNIIKPFSLTPIEQISRETVEICKKFNEEYKEKCIESIVKNHRFHYSFYRNVFKGGEFIDWVISKGLVLTREQGEELGRQLISGRVIHHISKKKDFHDGFNLYKFY